MTDKVLYSIVIPVYNGEETLAELLERIRKTFKNITENYEIIFIDDGSQDTSWQILERFHNADNKIKIIQLMRNFGQHNTLMCGFKYCKGDYIITMDDDLQHPPEEIPKLIQEIQKGYSVVYGQYRKKQHGQIRNWGSNLLNKTISDITGSKFNLTSFRIIKNDVIHAISKFDTPNVIIDILAFSVITNRDISYCMVEHAAREESQYTPLKLIKIALDLVLNYTVLPLRIATFLGLFFSLISFGIGITYLIMYLLNRITVSGFAALILSISFFSGIILFVLGIMGEYLGRMFLTLNKKPQYVVKQEYL